MKNSYYEVSSELTKKIKNHGNIKWVLRVGITSKLPVSIVLQWIQASFLIAGFLHLYGFKPTSSYVFTKNEEVSLKYNRICYQHPVS